MLQTYAMWGANSESWITYRGKVLVHDNKGEYEFLFPGVSVRPITVAEEDSFPIRRHPQLASVRWPLKREDFR